MHSCIIWWFFILLNSYDKRQTKINCEFIFQEKCLLIRYQLLWDKSNWPMKTLKDWKCNKNIVFNSKKHKFVLLMTIRLNLRQTLWMLRRILMKSEFFQVILLVAIYWSWCPICCDKNVKGYESLWISWHHLNIFWETSNHARYNVVKAIINSRMKDGSKPYYTYDWIANFWGYDQI